MFLALVVFALTLATRSTDEREPGPEVPQVPPETVDVRPIEPIEARAPRTFTAGGKTHLHRPVGYLDEGSPEVLGPLSLEAAVRAVEPAVQTCMQRWWMLDPALSGKLIVGFAITTEGLQQVWIEDHEGLEEPVLTCFSDAIWGLRAWPRPAMGETVVTWPFSFGEEPDEE
ncbi:MAG TPA: hypothetical protein QGF58_25905 [Myxococcota bacterium]|nr:hypothetical protein [Myxococcota bacterium]